MIGCVHSALTNYKLNLHSDINIFHCAIRAIDLTSLSTVDFEVRLSSLQLVIRNRTLFYVQRVPLLIDAQNHISEVGTFEVYLENVLSNSYVLHVLNDHSTSIFPLPSGLVFGFCGV